MNKFLDNYFKLKENNTNTKQEFIAGITKFMTMAYICLLYTSRPKEDEEGKLVENSFESSDKVNKIYWDRKVKYKDLFEYYKGLISLRKEYKAFRMNTNEEIKENIHFLKKGVNFSENNLVAYIIDAKNIDIKCEKIAVIINANNKDVDVELEESNWHVMVDEKTAGNEIIETIKDSKVNVSRKSIKVLIK